MASIPPCLVFKSIDLVYSSKTGKPTSDENSNPIHNHHVITATYKILESLKLALITHYVDIQ